MKIGPLTVARAWLNKILGSNPSPETTELPTSKAQGLDCEAASWELEGLGLHLPPLKATRELGGAPVITINKFLAHRGRQAQPGFVWLFCFVPKINFVEQF